MSIQEKFEAVNSAEYDKNAKPAVDIDLSLCANEDEKARMIHIVNRLAKSPCGLETLEIAKEGKFTFSFFEPGVKCFGACDEAGNWIKLAPNAPDDKLVGTLCHEARHAGQFVRGAHEAFGVQDVRSELILFRSMEADAQTYAVTACEELKQQGDAGPYAQFKDRYPEIEGAFSRALEKNGGKVDHEVMTATFKGWYDQLRTKTVYEESYQIEPMQKEVLALREGKAPSLMYTNSVGGEEAVAMAAWTKHGNYFTDDPKILESGKYLDVAKMSMDDIKTFFDIRQQLTGLEPDKSVDTIPVRPDTVFSDRPRMGGRPIAPLFESMKQAESISRILKFKNEVRSDEDRYKYQVEKSRIVSAITAKKVR